MTNDILSLTEGQLIIEMPGRGVSLRRVGKSTNFKRTKQNGVYCVTGKETKCNIPNENLDIIAETKPCHMIVHIRQQTVNHWSLTPFKGEPKKGNKIDLMKFVETMRKLRFEYHLNEHARHLCEQANIRPSRCKWSYKSDNQ